MEKVLFYLISAPLFLGIWFSNNTVSDTKKSFVITDTVPPKGDSIRVNSCIKCHSNVVGKKVIHKPAINDCSKCHQSTGLGNHEEDGEGFKLVNKVPELCYACHDVKTIIKEQIHTPLKDGDCFSCHDVHSSKGEHLLSIPPPGLCYSCHSDLKKNIDSATVKHGALTEAKSCINCHSPHSSSEKNNLLLPQPDLCFTCHDKQIKVGDVVLPNMKSLMTQSKYVHGAMDMGGCTACHNPHGSSNSLLLKKTFPSSENYSTADKKNYALCLECHESSLFEEAKTTEATGFRDGERNLHFVHVNKEKGRTCINCHNVHASNSLYLISDKTKFGQSMLPMNFTKLPKGGTCAPGCHSEKTYTR
jgi:predicted CXXCH cytochrome family protein